MTHAPAATVRSSPWPPALARAAVLVLLCAVFVRANFAPIGTLDSYSDWKYGEWIRAHKELPTHEPFSPFSDSTRLTSGAGWLGQVLYSLPVSAGGLEGAALFHALLEVAKAGLFLLAARRASGSLGIAVGLTVLMEAFCWPYTNSVHTGTLAEVCWAAVLLACSARAPNGPAPSGWQALMPSWAAVAAVPILVAVWANLHEFLPAQPLGRLLARDFAGLKTNVSEAFFPPFVFIAALLVGQFLDRLRTGRGRRAAGPDRGLLRIVLLTALALIAMTFTPHGKELLKGTFVPAASAILEARRWPKLVPTSTPECWSLLAAALIVLAVLRLSPRRFSATEVLLLAVFGISSWFVKSMAIWWLMLLPLLLAPHARALIDTLRPDPDAPFFLPFRPMLPRLAYALAVVVSLSAIAFSPAADWLRGHPLPAARRVGPSEPYDLAEKLPAESAPRRIYNAPYFWGDYLLWRLPSDESVFWYSRTEGFSSQNRADAALLTGADPSSAEWRELVRRHNITAVVVNAKVAPALYAYLKEHPEGEWKVIAIDGDGLAAVRREQE
jgi:hypothetical protein